MSYVIAEPLALASVAAEIEGIGSAFSAATAAAAAPTSGVAAAAGEKVSAAIADVFGAVGKEYQAVVAQFEAFHTQFQQTLASAGLTYAETEAAIASTLALGRPRPPRRCRPPRFPRSRPTWCRTSSAAPAFLSVAVIRHPGQQPLRPIGRRPASAVHTRGALPAGRCEKPAPQPVGNRERDHSGQHAIQHNS